MKNIKTLALAAAILSGLAIAAPSPAEACDKGDRFTQRSPSDWLGGNIVERCVCQGGKIAPVCEEVAFEPWEGAS